jgi:Rad51
MDVKSIEQYKAKPVIVYSIITLHRGEYSGIESLAERQQRLCYAAQAHKTSQDIQYCNSCNKPSSIPAR